METVPTWRGDVLGFMLLIFRGEYGSGVKGYATLAPKGIKIWPRVPSLKISWLSNMDGDLIFWDNMDAFFFPGRYKLYIHTSYILSNPFLSLKSWAPAAVFIQAPSTGPNAVSRNTAGPNDQKE